MEEKEISALLDFIQRSPSEYHVIDNLSAALNGAGYVCLPARERWTIEPGGKYYTLRGGSSRRCTFPGSWFGPGFCAPPLARLLLSFGVAALTGLSWPFDAVSLAGLPLSFWATARGGIERPADLTAGYVDKPERVVHAVHGERRTVGRERRRHRHIPVRGDHTAGLYIPPFVGARRLRVQCALALLPQRQLP